MNQSDEFRKSPITTIDLDEEFIFYEKIPDVGLVGYKFDKDSRLVQAYHIGEDSLVKIGFVQVFKDNTDVIKIDTIYQSTDLENKLWNFSKKCLPTLNLYDEEQPVSHYPHVYNELAISASSANSTTTTPYPASLLPFWRRNVLTGSHDTISKEPHYQSLPHSFSDGDIRTIDGRRSTKS